MGGFIILGADVVKIIEARFYYSVEYTDNKSEKFALWNYMYCLTGWVWDGPDLRCPTWAFGAG